GVGAGRGVADGQAAGPLEAFAAQLRRQLRDARVSAEVSVRPRHCVSLQRARLRRGVELGPTDFGRLLVVVEENADCYAVLGELHTCWTPLPGEFKDYIAAPKFNLYQSLHTSVATGPGEVVEVLVRTARMHQIAEFGVVALGAPGALGALGALTASDAATPGGGQTGAETAADGAADETEVRDPLDHTDPGRPGWLARLLDWQRDTPDPDTFWSQLTADLAGDGEITVLAGDVGEGGRPARLQLPAGATGVDAAYAPGEEHGHRCIGMRVNGRLTALSTPLHDGDTVELLTEPPGEETAGPAPEWLAHARTPGARIAIERWLAGHPEPEQAAGAPPASSADAPRARRAGVGALLGGGPVDAGRAVITAPAMPDASVRLARCCTPVPPDELLCFAIRGGGLAAHRDDCPTGTAMHAAGRPPVEARWLESPTPTGYRVTIQADALGRPRLLADLTAAMSGAGVDIISAEVEPPRELQVRHTYTVELPAAEALPELMRAMLRVPGVYDVYRASGTGGRASGRAAADAEAETLPEADAPAVTAGVVSRAAGPAMEAVGTRNDGDRSRRGVRPSRGMRGRPAAFSPLGDSSELPVGHSQDECPEPELSRE
uniref:ACT domain-containing protein n=1 Tax=Streptacidiphilus neutrinimicus TaxID=105420 RepID=UPI000694F781